MVKIFSLIVLTLVLAGTALWKFTNKEIGNLTEITENALPEATKKNESEQFWIESLGKRTYSAGKIIRQEVHRKTTKYDSFVMSYVSEGYRINALLNIPSGSKPDNGWPVVIVNHGYIAPEVFSTKNSYINTSGFFADSGFLVIKPDYRGHAESEGQAVSLADRLNYAVDVLNLLEGISQIPEADQERIYMWGHSMGGEITLKVIEVSNKIKAASLWAPAVTSFPENALYFSRRTQTERYQRFKAEFEQIFADGSGNKASSLENVHLVQIPVNVQHGTSDESVPYEWSTALRDRMVSAAKKVNFYTYDNDNHDLTKNWSRALGRDVDLFQSH